VRDNPPTSGSGRIRLAGTAAALVCATVGLAGYSVFIVLLTNGTGISAEFDPNTFATVWLGFAVVIAPIMLMATPSLTPYVEWSATIWLVVAGSVLAVATLGAALAVAALAGEAFILLLPMVMPMAFIGGLVGVLSVSVGLWIGALRRLRDLMS
jgi:hypothetical protein